MSQFVQIGQTSLNLSRVNVVQWHGLNTNRMSATVFFSDGEPHHVVGEDAATLSNIVSACEARTEVELRRYFDGADCDCEGGGVEEADGGPELGSEEAMAALVLSGPWAA